MTPCIDPNCGGHMLSRSVRTSGATRIQYLKCSICPKTDKRILRMDLFGRYVLGPSKSLESDMEVIAYDLGKETKP